MGPLKHVQELNDISGKYLEETIALNYSSFVYLTSVFVKLAIEMELSSVRIINISSLAALKSFESWSIYGSIKAGREHFLAHIAEENSEKSNFYFISFYWINV